MFFYFYFLVGNHLKHVEMQKQKFKYFFKMAAIAAILDFGPSPKSNGMILGPYLTPHQVSSKSVEEFFRNTVHKQTNKQAVIDWYLRNHRLDL